MPVRYRTHDTQANTVKLATPLAKLAYVHLDLDKGFRLRRQYVWPIEIFYRTLKSGCRIEDRQFETLDRILNCLAVYSIIAWKIMYLSRIGCECPELSCEIIFEPSEWKSVYMTIRHEPPPSTPPSLNEMIRMIASLGGYVIRRSTKPGTQTLWFGLQRVHDLSTHGRPSALTSSFFLNEQMCGTMREDDLCS